MKTFFSLAIVGGLCLTLASAQTYQPSAEAIKSVNAQALAYTGKRCTSTFKARTPRQMPRGDFSVFVSFVDKAMREAAKQDPSIKLKATRVSDTLYIAAADSHENGLPRSEFVVLFYDQGMAYTYSCDLK